MPPPPPTPATPLTVLLSMMLAPILTSPSSSLKMPPPIVARLPAMVLATTTRRPGRKPPLLKMPPPLSALLPLIVLKTIDRNLPRLKTPPPLPVPAAPPLMATFSISAGPPPTCKMAEQGRAPAWFDNGLPPLPYNFYRAENVGNPLAHRCRCLPPLGIHARFQGDGCMYTPPAYSRSATRPLDRKHHQRQP